MPRAILALALALGIGVVAAPASAQSEETLADIRQELSVLFVEIQRLKRELVTTGGATGLAGGGSILDRVDAIEGELTRLIAKTEELENRVDRIVRDGTNRIGDLEFRLVELEGGDVSQLGETTTLGGEELPAVAGGSAPAASGATGGGGAELALGEQSDFDAAVASYEAGDYAGAAEAFRVFTETYPGGPLTADAQFLRGASHAALGEDGAAARAYLEAFSIAPEGPRAPGALVGLGTALGRLGQIEEACVTLAEVGFRFPGSAAVAEAEAERSRLACQ